jgi:hypothetical protein
VQVAALEPDQTAEQLVNLQLALFGRAVIENLGLGFHFVALRIEILMLDFQFLAANRQTEWRAKWSCENQQRNPKTDVILGLGI